MIKDLGIYRSPKDSAYIRESRELVKIAASSKTNPLELSQMCFDMDKKYPCRGWDEAGRKIHNRLAKQIGICKI